MTIAAPDLISTLTTIRDYIRWGASRFTEQGVFLGHGTATALDEAAAIVLHTVHQPYDLADAYLGSVLTLAEREAVIELIERRIVERLPSAYLTHEALFAGLAFYVDERVLVPRSPIAELIDQRFEPWIDESDVIHILDLCSGSGCIAIACAYAFPEAHIDAVELSDDALAVAAINIDKHDLAEQVELHRSDLFDDLPEKSYDIIVSNPPYVSSAEWQALPAEFHAEPAMGFKGGDNGLDLVLRMLADASRYLSEQGILVVEVGSSAQTLQDTFPQVPFHWLEFERGGDGVFLLTAQQVAAYHTLFKSAL
ncbi:MAG: 50S ribosomal protein L3 N(5)-glutamine methyltransferase [Methylomonas sp.]|nr:50S ribosomal protein L3 N(5)-glutamine methyltransferase [Methylomonas sp.]PPD22446.1 MAG: 50S ribosomal protein L3 N(5)-glutamine methyltransferase [Methylomonas sp.]PPD26885.1 MAG: 50S ribosomal protein L3 N(5)-glutamine methyltransferase [Methylomonas sp.]PPD38793.1 MAG: 50S ribosomal protein L3 N(5)-glutamine methyltransferase [Methylomonas sp.]PPD40206.1 MAG: 50S ribosomal protein L3 N(5)-glutamine methyltransferase [Methylomonas sp.]